MNFVTKLFRRLRALVRKEAVNRDLADEVAFHLEKQTERNLAAGMSAEEARYAALKSFGGVEQVKEECRDAWGVRFIDDLVQDVRFALRVLVKNPGFTAVSIITLALGIGANTAIFSVVDAVLFRPLAYRDPGRLAWLSVAGSSSWWGTARVWRPDFVAWREQNQVLEQIAAFDGFHGFNLTGGSTPIRVRAMRVTSGFFPLLGVPPARGRTFLPGESQPGHNRVAVLSHGLWVRTFNADLLAIGKSIALDGLRYTIIGVMPATFKNPCPGQFDMWLPLPDDAASDRPGNSVNFLQVLGRLKTGIDPEAVQANLETITRRLDREYPSRLADTHSKQWVVVIPLQRQLAGDSRRALFVLLGVVGFVLFIACANVANLLLARAAVRRKEIALRATLGATRARLIGQLLAESTLLAMMGGVLGFLMAAWCVDALKILVPEAIPNSIGVNLQVLVFTTGISILTGIVFGLAPALITTRVDLNEALKDGGIRATTVSSHRRLRSGLVVSEVALSLILLIGAGLLIRSFSLILEVDPGFNPHNLLTAEVWLPSTEPVLSDHRGQAAFFAQVLDRIRALPGVKSAGVTTHAPLKMFDRLDSGLNIEGRAPLENAVSVSAVSSDYFRTMGIRLLSGRDFSEQDAEGKPGVVIINESFARLAFPHQNPLGRRIGGQPPQLTVVGVVSDFRNLDLDKEVWPEMYWPYRQRPSPFMTLAVRSDSNPSSLAAAVRAQVLAVDKNQPVFDIQTLEERLSASVAPRRFRMLLLGVFAAIALMLAAVGTYGVMAYSVAQRTHELGVRMALGAAHDNVLKMILRQGLGMALTGTGIGVLGARALTCVLKSMLFSVRPTDMLTFVVASVTLLTVTLLACYLPARRATKVDPMEALRYE